jgi:hypothetical protein
MTDEFGDGWDNAVLKLTVDGVDHEFGNYFTAGLESTDMIEICDFPSTTYEMTSGSYPSEISWSVTCGEDESFSGV